MTQKFSTHKVLLILLFIIAGTTVKAQVGALGDLTAGTLAAYCPSDQVKLTAASSNATTYTWKRYAGTNTSGTATLVAGQTTANMVDTPLGQGYYTYVSTGLNADGCESIVSDPATIYKLPGITAAIVSSAPATTQYCASAVPTTLTLTATGGKAQSVTETFVYKYQWYRDGVAITGATNSTYVLNATDDATVGANIPYTVKITYQIKACTETTSNAINFTVLALPGKPTVTITP
jgi:hypothetical protein